MIRKIDHSRMGHSDKGWLTSWFHFSFAEYFNPENMQYGALRVLNDDLIQPHAGFDLHPHRNMEIITYVINGELTHEDSMKKRRVLGRGDVQYMSAGTGIYHSERNDSDKLLRLLQIWILPDKADYPPQYGDFQLPWEDRKNRWLPLASGKEGDAPIRIHQDVGLYVAEIVGGNSLQFDVHPGRQVYLVAIEGEIDVNGVLMSARDAAEIGPDFVRIQAGTTSHVLRIDMAASQSLLSDGCT